MTVKRYDCRIGNSMGLSTPCCEMYSNPVGNFVSYSDYIELNNKLKSDKCFIMEDYELHEMVMKIRSTPFGENTHAQIINTLKSYGITGDEKPKFNSISEAVENSNEGDKFKVPSKIIQPFKRDDIIKTEIYCTGRFNYFRVTRAHANGVLDVVGLDNGVRYGLSARGCILHERLDDGN